MAATYAVLSGDLVKSSRLSKKQLDHVRSVFRKASHEVGDWKAGLVEGEPDFFRGDAWQMLLSDPTYGLRVAIYLRAALMARVNADTRVVIGLGGVRDVKKRRISQSTGEAFEDSGTMLDRMPNYYKMSIVAPRSAGSIVNLLEAVGNLCDMLVSRWTTRQAEIVLAALPPVFPKDKDGPPAFVTHEDISRVLKPQISRQAVSKALLASGWHGLRSAIRQFEAVDWHMLPTEKP